MKSLLSIVLLCLTVLCTKAQNITASNPPDYPYGVNINVSYPELWAREFSLTHSGTGKLFAFGVYGNGANLEYGYIGGNTSEISPFNSPWMVFKGNGNIGIGTSNPGTYKLAVEGTIGARKVKVTTLAWADFVFEDDYKLLTIPELEKYILLHKHLPDIPSAKEVNLDGIELGEMNKKLLQKIEEQALYIIELNKKLEGLTERFNQLEKK